MKFFFTEDQALHRPQHFMQRGQIKKAEDQPERAEVLKAAALKVGLEACEATQYPEGALALVHTADYLDFLTTGYAQWSELPDFSDEIRPNVHPNGHSGRKGATYPDHIIGRAGWHMADCASPIGPDTIKASIGAANVALSAAETILGGEREAYALCRPPGHHAGADQAAGHCYLNNLAIAAEHLGQKFSKIAVLDIDVHHGNGTQSIFYERNDVLTISIHADPRQFYPFYWGYDHETGKSAGTGFNRNYPLPLGTDEGLWLATIDDCLNRVSAFEPEVLIIALGLDAYEHDPLGAFRVTTTGFGVAGGKIGAVDLPVLLVHEGGYMTDALGDNLQEFLSAFMEKRE
jgi:acetoin utilization deacetylase AcuC-like enzyme